jgi:ATP-dependent DNA ligase
MPVDIAQAHASKADTSPVQRAQSGKTEPRILKGHEVVPSKSTRPPKWIKPQLTRLVDEAPPGGGRLHEIKYDGYRMHARIDGGQVKLLTRTGLGLVPSISAND